MLFVEGDIEWSVYAYMRSRASRTLSASALAHRIAAVGWLFAYYRERGRPVLDKPGATDFYEELAEALLEGNGDCGYMMPCLQRTPSGIRNVSRYLRGIRYYSEFLTAEFGAPVLCPTVTADSSQLARGFRMHLERRKATSLFNHLIDVPRSMATTRIPAADIMGSRGRGIATGAKSKPVPFPEKHIADFFGVGLKRRKVANRCGNPVVDNYNVRDILYFLLLMFGGLRGAEPLHLFVDDIQPDDELGQGASVFLWHPAEGPSPDPLPPGRARSSAPTRREYLAARFNRVPRNEMRADPQAAGWKNLLLDEAVPKLGSRTRVYWQNPSIGHLFWKMHGAYMTYVRPKVSTHPYYFVSLDRGAFSSPWTDASAQDAFAAAMRRMGLQPSSATGLCRHAMRHRLGYRLTKCGLRPEEIQIFLHHQSLASQADYSRQQPADVARALAAASEKVERGISDFRESDLGLFWKSDPLHLYGGPSETLLRRLLNDGLKST